MVEPTVQGSTTIETLLMRHPDGRAMALMSRLGWPCAYCNARVREPLSLAAQRHGNPVAAVIRCFRGLEDDGPSEADIAAATARRDPSRDPTLAWLRTARE